jgi:hypothetical protein
LEILAQDVGENIIGIRVATPEETQIFLKVSDHYEEQVNAAVSDDEVTTL